MNLPLLIARRYLFAKKSHNVINIISAISTVGMALGTAALIVILSVYNGFSDLVKSSLSSVEPDLRIEKTNSKVFMPAGEDLSWMRSLPGVRSVSGILEENVFLSAGERNGIAMVRGLDEAADSALLAGKIVDGEFKLFFGDVPMAVAGVGVAYKMDLNPRLHKPLEMYFPDRKKAISTINPAASLRKEKIWVSGLFSITSDLDENLVITSYKVMSRLLGYDKGEVSALEIRFEDSPSGEKIIRQTAEIIRSRLGEDFAVKDRYAQNETLYKMMRSEKAAVYLILIFVVIIIAFNIFGCLAMLIIEKEDDIKTLGSLGADDKMIRRIFILEGWMISLLGLFIGLILGAGLVFLQQQTSLVSMPGAFAINAYPVIITWSDVLITAASIAIIGYFIALIPTNKYLRKEK